MPALAWHRSKWRRCCVSIYSRLAAALQQIGQPLEAVAVLAPLFSRAKQVFLPVMQPIQASPSVGGGTHVGTW